MYYINNLSILDFRFNFPSHFSFPHFFLFLAFSLLLKMVLHSLFIAIISRPILN